MSNQDYLDKIRNARERKCVLKAAVLNLRSRCTETPIFIFEGKTDIGPYETWISRIDNTLNYFKIPGKGKGQLLEFRHASGQSYDKNLSKLYFFIDNDFDGLRGFENSNNLFCLQSYSFENYLVTNGVLNSILNDELECSTELDCIDSTVACYEATFRQFAEIMTEANFRFYLAAKYNLERGRVCNKLSKFVDINIDSVVAKHERRDLDELIPITHELSQDDIASARASFGALTDPVMQFRGKYNFEFFIVWLEKIAEARKKGNYPSKSAQNIKFNRASLSFRSLASRSELPEGLATFLSKVAA